MATIFEPGAPQRGVGTARQRELLKSARTQLGAILEGPEAPRSDTFLWQEVIRIQGLIEKLLGY